MLIVSYCRSALCFRDKPDVGRSVMNKITTMERYLRLKKEVPTGLHNKQALEWSVLNTLQSSDQQAYNTLLKRMTSAGRLKDFYEILDRVAMSDDGTFYIQKSGI